MDYLVFIGDKFIGEPHLRGLVVQRIEQQCGFPKQQLIFHDRNLEMIEHLAPLVERSSHMVIVTSSASLFVSASKMVATLTQDTLIHVEGKLIPSKTLFCDEGIFTIATPHGELTVMRYDVIPSGCEIPPVQQLHIFGYDVQTAVLLLEPLASACDVMIHGFEHSGGWSVVRVKGQKHGLVEHFVEKAKVIMPYRIIAGDDIVAHCVDVLAQEKKTITFAESCTGGLLASMFTSISGASQIFNGSMVTYSNEIKNEWIGVSSSLLEDHGAVSESVVLAMSSAIRHEAQADFALALSGIAGPNGGTQAKPVGTVFVAISTFDGVRTAERLSLKGTREQVQYSAAYHAIRLLIEQKKELFCK